LPDDVISSSAGTILPYYKDLVCVATSIMSMQTHERLKLMS